MKSYEERLPLIDAAIDELKGEFPPTAIGYSGRGYYAKGDFANILHGVNIGDICTRDEFNQRKAERQNKPSWPDAPEWANWLAQGVSGVRYWWSDKPIAKGGFWVSDVGDNDHPDPKMDRASSKGEVIGNWQDTIEKRPKQKEQDMNDWYEKGELPPVGEVCILVSVGFTELNHEVEITYMGDGVGCYRWLKSNNEYTVNLCDAKFRPLRTETDKMVEQMCDDAGRIEGAELNPFIVAAIERLAEQGYRKIKPMSEQEFMKQCVDICGHGDARLYRAGCRFIEQVKV